uniref:IQ domain-containing GTPase activating protein n=1 Tax=Cryptococcus bacillisporus CA1280 TaxID=1296109 RepID=A0A0D0VYN1_CRYGA|nr:IQ domain-containing GTPase activating protein [Cryptococcus bacillisporus CA1280]
MSNDQQHSPPRGTSGLGRSSSIFSYQTRLLARNNSNTSLSNGRQTPTNYSSITASPAYASLASIAGKGALADSPPSTPIRRAVAKMIIDNSPSPTPTPTARTVSKHVRTAKSVDLVRNQWEAKIAGAQDGCATHTMQKGGRDISVTPRTAPMPSDAQLPTPSSIPSTESAEQAVTQVEVSPTKVPISFDSEKDGSSRFSSSYMAQRVAKRATVYGASEFDSIRIPSTVSKASAPVSPIERPASPSIAPTVPLLSPNTTGEILAPSVRGQSVEERLAIAKANALKRRQAREQAKAAVTHTQPAAQPTVEKGIISGQQKVVLDDESGIAKKMPSQDKVTLFQSEMTNGKIEANASHMIKLMPDVAVAKQPPPSIPLASKVVASPLHDPFTPSSRLTETTPAPSTVSDSNPLYSRSSLRSIVTPPSASSSTSRYIPSDLSSSVASASPSESSAPSSGGGKYGSISRTDRRRLGRHLPRIASGEKGWEDDEASKGNGNPSEGRRVPSTLGKHSTILADSEEENKPPGPKIGKKIDGHVTTNFVPKASIARATRPPDILAPSANENQPYPQASRVPSTPSKRRSQFMPFTPKSTITDAINPKSPRLELTGEEMKGLMNAVGSLPARGDQKDEEDGVTGMSNRLRLTKSRLPPSASSASVAPIPLPSKRLIQTNWMDKHRHALGSYEYLCHVGEAQQWIEGCLEEELPFGVTEMEEGLKNGVVLAKLARVYEGEEVVKKIWTKLSSPPVQETKHRYKQSDNINYFLNFVRNVGMPETFIFELTDLYNKKNIPKVIFCIHVLSHLLARLGRAERIGNLVGQFEFTNEQIAAAQKDLQGIAMPNFGDAGKSLAKEASWAPEEPEETEDEKRDRLLQECEDSIVGLQRHLQGHLARMRSSRIQAQLELAEPITRRLQARARGALCRRALSAELEKRKHLHSMARSIQAAVRGRTVRKSWEKRAREVRNLEVVGLQAHLKGLLARTKRKTVEKGLGNTMKGVTGLQAHCRGCLVRRGRRAYKTSLEEPQTVQSISSFQALLRGRLHRQTAATQQRKIVSQIATFTSLQSHLRGAIVRRNIRAQGQKMDDATNYVVAVQAVARGILTRNKKRIFTRELQQSTSSTVSFQAFARAHIAKQSHKSMQKALAKVEVAGSVGGLQAFLRTKLAKKQTTEQKKKLEFVQPDVIGFQAMARGYLAREEYHFWRDYLHDGKTIGALVFLQSLMRGFIARRRHYIRTSFIHRNVDKIVKIQALWRGRQQRVSYEKLITGVDVDVPTIQSYMHLLDDTESDFADQVRIEALRGQVVDLIRENQTLETEVKDLDTKIALIINNQMTFQELARAKRRTETATYHAPNNDPFSSGVHLDRTNQRKLELYEQLFFMLQTKPEYISRLLRVLSIDDESAEKERRLVEGVTMILFAFGHERREEYLFHKLLQLAVHEDILRAPTLQDLVHSRFPIIPVTAQYIKTSLTPYIHNVIAPHVMRIVDAPELDLCTDPVRLYLGAINAEETQTGMPSALPRDRNADQILQEHAITRALFIRNLQELRNLTDFLLTDLLQSHDKLPYTIRLMAREALLALQRKFPEAMDDDLVPVVARTVILPFLLPAIVAPEQFGMAPDGVGAVERRNLSELANLLTHVAGQGYTDTPDQRLIRTPLEAFITAMAFPFREWLLDVANVEHAEGHFHAHELFESTIEAKPIKITRKGIYGMLSALIQHVDVLTHGSKKDPIVPILEELEGPPIDYDKSKNQVNLRLTNRLAGPTPGDPKAGAKADWIQAKRHVLAVLRVQTGKTLFDVLVSRPEDIHEQLWIQEVHRDIALENARKARHGLPPAHVEAEYQIESIRSLPFHEVKSRAIEFCMKLERSGRLSREDNLQGLLVSIASDIRQKHHLRKLRKDNLAGMIKAHEDMSKKKGEFEGRVQAYHDYIDGAMAELQAKGKKKPLFMSKQYRHQMSQKKQGKQAKFGSYKYTAADLYGKRILLSVNQFSPRQFDKLFIVISSNEVGVFNLELSYPSSTTLPGSSLRHDEVRMEDLLGAQYENKERLDMFEGQAAFNLNMLIHQINKSKSPSFEVNIVSLLTKCTEFYNS